MVSICSEREIRIYNLEQKVDWVIPEENAITSLSISKGGRYLLVNLVSQEIHLWEINQEDRSGKPFKYKGYPQGGFVTRSYFGGSDEAFILSGSEDSRAYIMSQFGDFSTSPFSALDVTNRGRLVNIWHRGDGGFLARLQGHSGTVNCVSWNPVNPYMFASGSNDHTVRMWGFVV